VLHLVHQLRDPQRLKFSAGVFAVLAEVGAERDEAQEAKTRWALTYYASKFAGRRSKKPGARAKGSRRQAK
jgi:hypothetical protein